jgi:hypothetical protein
MNYWIKDAVDSRFFHNALGYFSDTYNQDKPLYPMTFKVVFFNNDIQQYLV